MPQGTVGEEKRVAVEDPAIFSYFYEGIYSLHHLSEKKCSDFLVLFSLCLHTVHPANSIFSLEQIQMKTKSIYMKKNCDTIKLTFHSFSSQRWRGTSVFPDSHAGASRVYADMK